MCVMEGVCHHTCSTFLPPGPPLCPPFVHPVSTVHPSLATSTIQVLPPSNALQKGGGVQLKVSLNFHQHLLGLLDIIAREQTYCISEESDP